MMPLDAEAISRGSGTFRRRDTFHARVQYVNVTVSGERA